MFDHFESASLVARINATSSIAVCKSFPDRVLDETWRDVRFFYGDIAALSMLPILQSLIETERSTICYVADLEGQRTRDRLYGFFVTLATKPDGFLASWLEGGRLPRVARVDNHACASERGEWIIYCEREDDLGFVAFKDPTTGERYRDAIAALRAENITTFLQRKSEVPPFDKWYGDPRRRLLEHYA